MSSTHTSDLWSQCAHQLEEKLPSQQFNTWIRPLQANIQNNTVRLFAPNHFVLDWVKKNHFKQISQLLADLSGNTAIQVSLEIGSSTPEPISAAAPQKAPSATSQPPSFSMPQASSPKSNEPILHSNLNPAFNFDTFVEGKSNQLARAASIQISENPGKTYNPLFIYGGVGLGKTHLMHAVGNMMLKNNPASRVIYLHSERFVSDMVRALQRGAIDEFKRHYRSVNALLIDDVQFFAGKDRSQEEFFHTFNALFDSQQQIILSCDRYPKEVVNLEERLKSRFGWGLTVAVEPPDLETRVAILKNKANALNINLPDDVAFFIGKRIRSNIRELEGGLRRIIAHAEFTGSPISLKITQDALRDMLAAQDRQVTIENIQKIVSEYFGIRSSEMSSASRTRSIVRPRQI
ncbi:MAG: chromosomal replication initiator protein DnaA, partial [gamma proteobacterium symbiont of Bathyaustriella thionipta]|nr:chromosomal replication initiator protein DnaA [gamma proteobacterium symbiont of Bathyaustriella thionipta]